MTTRGLSLAVCLLLLAVPALAHAAASDHFLQATQYRLDSSAPNAARQILHCWQVSEGAWEGQSLAGLSLVLVQQVSVDGRPATAAIYVSEFASPAQRQALLSALAAAHPALFADRTSSGARLEPAVIQIEILDGQTILLHLGRVA